MNINIPHCCSYQLKMATLLLWSIWIGNVAVEISHYSLNNNVPCDAIYLDFSKAFDSVPHKELLLKLWNCGVTSNLRYWIRNYHVCIRGWAMHMCTTFSSIVPFFHDLLWWISSSSNSVCLYVYRLVVCLVHVSVCGGISVELFLSVWWGQLTLSVCWASVFT